MNVFRSKKNKLPKETGEDVSRASHESESSAPLKPMKTFRRNKKKEQEVPKFELDLVNALPASDDFRQSLLMTGLSARFSMLREQDDPNSKLGKASDDSVLFPRRQSRMNNFDFTPKGLTGISEGGSGHKESFSRPFTSIDTERVGSSYSNDGFGNDFGGNIMDRAKPAEGNVLFGGRQKVYKVPNHSASAKNSDPSKTSGLGGRPIYDDDLGLSAFQRMKLREKEEREEKERHSLANSEEAQETTTSRPDSPTFSGYNRNRETSSTTSSGPSGARSSTAATSFMSGRTPSVTGNSAPSTPAVPNQGTTNAPDRSFSKKTRPFENGIDEHPSMYQSSGPTGLDNQPLQPRSLAVRSPSPDAPRFQRTGGQSSAGRLATSTSAFQPAKAGFNFGVTTIAPELKKASKSSRPFSPPQSEGEDHKALPVQSGVRKGDDAPAKPRQAYDEGKYEQRQLQMQQGRDAAPMRKNSPPGVSPVAKTPDGEARSRAESQASSSQGYDSARSRSQSSTQRDYAPRERMLPPSRRDVVSPDGQAASPRFFTPRHDPVPTPALTPISEPPKPQVSAWEQASAYDEFQADMPPSLRTAKMPPPQHPALRRDRTKDQDEPTRNIRVQAPSAQGSRLPSPIETDKMHNISQPADSPTLPPPGGLSGMVRQHLRSDSDASSVTYDASPTASSHFSEAQPKPQAAPGQTRFLPNQPDSRATSTASDTPSWEKELYRHHSRDMSTDTQQERDDFASELAARRKKVQENLRNFAESESRSQSPVRAPSAQANEASFAKNNRLNFLKSKTSKTSLTNSEAPPSNLKALNMLGMGSNGSSITVNSSSRFDDGSWKQEEEDTMRGVPKASKTPPAADFRQGRRDAQRERERQMMSRQKPANGYEVRSSDEQSRRHMEQPPRQPEYGRQRHPSSRPRSPSRDAPPVSFRPQTTSRNGSQPPSAANSRPGTGDRSSSEGRNGGYRDDRGRTNSQGVDEYGRRLMSNSPSLPPTGAIPPLPRSGPPPRDRAESRAQPFPGYFESHSGRSTNTSPNFEGIAQRQAPLAPYAVHSTPPLAQQSPMGSISSTPTTPHGFQVQHNTNQRMPGGRKKSVNKSEISEPQFVSTTSRISTINIQSNGSGGYTPALPAMDPRRRQQPSSKSMFSAWGGRKDDSPNSSSPDLPQHMQNQMYGGDRQAEQPQPREQRKLRKMSSDGAGLSARGRQVYATPAPAMPSHHHGDVPGGMF